MSDQLEETAVEIEPYLAETATGDREPYDWDRATIFVGLTIHPNDGNPGGRRISVTAWTHRDPPVATTCRKDELGPLPAPVASALLELRAAFPAREAASRERVRIEAERKATATAASQARKEAEKKSKPANRPAKTAGAAATPDTASHPASVATAADAAPLFAGVGREEEQE